MANDESGSLMGRVSYRVTIDGCPAFSAQPLCVLSICGDGSLALKRVDLSDGMFELEGARGVDACWLIVGAEDLMWGRLKQCATIGASEEVVNVSPVPLSALFMDWSGAQIAILLKMTQESDEWHSLCEGALAEAWRRSDESIGVAVQNVLAAGLHDISASAVLCRITGQPRGLTVGLSVGQNERGEQRFVMAVENKSEDRRYTLGKFARFGPRIEIRDARGRSVFATHGEHILNDARHFLAKVHPIDLKTPQVIWTMSVPQDVAAGNYVVTWAMNDNYYLWPGRCADNVVEVSGKFVLQIP